MKRDWATKLRKATAGLAGGAVATSRGLALVGLRLGFGELS